MPSFYLRLIGYTLLTAIVFGAGWKVADWRDTARLEALRTADATERADGEAAARTALTAQLAQVQTVTRNNQAAMVTLANQNAQTAADRDATVARVHRLEQLLATAAARSAASGAVPKTGDRPATAGATGDPGIDRAGELLIAARNECRRNADRLRTLIAEIRPQL